MLMIWMSEPTKKFPNDNSQTIYENFQTSAWNYNEETKYMSSVQTRISLLSITPSLDSRHCEFMELSSNR